MGDFLSPTMTQSVSSSTDAEETAMMGFSKGPGWAFLGTEEEAANEGPEAG